MNVADQNGKSKVVSGTSVGETVSAHVLEQGNPAAVENPSSPANNYAKVRPGNVQAVILNNTSPNAIGGSGSASDRMLFKLRVTAVLAGTITIAGFLDQANAPLSYVLPVGFVGEVDFGGARNAGGALTIQLSAAGDQGKAVATYGVV